MPYRPENVGGGGGVRAVTGPQIRDLTPSSSTKKKKKEGGFWGAIHEVTGQPGDILHALHVMAAPIPWVLGHHVHEKHIRALGNIGSTLGSAPIDVTAHPESTAKNLTGMVVGLGESPYAITKSIQKFGLHKTLSMIYHSTVADYKRRYGANWEQEAKKNPLYNLSDLFMFLGPAMGAGATAGAARELSMLGTDVSKLALGTRGALIKGGRSLEWADMSPLEKLRIARGEAKTPGLYTQGAPKTRDLSLQIGAGDAIFPEGKVIESSQPLARGHLRRGIQRSLDDLAQQFPDLPMAGARSRIVRANAAQLPRTMDRVLGSIVGLDALKGLSRVEKTRLWAQAQLIRHVVDPETGAIIHDHADVTAKIKDLRNALASEFENTSPHHLDDPQLHDWLLGAKQHGFGKALLKRLDDAIAYEPKAGGRYERAIPPLIRATEVSEQVIKDTNGHTWLGNDQKRLFDRLKAMSDENGQVLPEHVDEAHHVADQLREVTSLLAAKGPQIAQMLPRRRALLLDWVKAHTPVDAPERAAWGEAMAKEHGWEPQQVRDMQMITDMIARSARPEDPASFYAEKIGSPKGLTPEQLAVRASTFFQHFPEWGTTPLVEGDVLAPAKTSAYYSKAQKEIADNWGTKPFKQAGQVKAQLEKNISPDEFKNAGLDLFFDRFGKNEMISQEQLHTHLSIPLNAHNLHEIHLVNSNDAFFENYGSQYHDRAFTARDAKEGEYHEIIFTLPEHENFIPDRNEGDFFHRSPPGHYGGEGLQHWGVTNVTGHTRFHMFMEDGKLKLLVEEIQSDWLSDVRKRAAEGRHYDPELADLSNEAKIQGAYNDAFDEWRRTAEAHGEGSQEAVTAHEKAVTAENRMQEFVDYWEGDRVPPPAPLNAKRHSELAVDRILRFAGENGVDEVIFPEAHVQHARNLMGGFIEQDEAALAWKDALASPERTSGGLLRPVARTTEAARAEAEKVMRGEKTIHHALYEKDFPARAAKRLGIEGERSDNAYQGRFSTQYGDLSKEGPMHGTVFKLDNALRERASQPSALYQQQPEWGKVPRGANELLAGKGHRLIHMFRTADISTWIHELAHSAVFDLAEADAHILNAHYGGGKAVTSWDNATHENFARDFERYVRTGDLSFLPRPVQEVFLRIQAWMQRVYRETKAANPEKEIPQEVQDVFGRMLYRDQGGTPDIFMPHRAGAPELTGARTAKGVPRAARDIGDYAQSRIPIYARNNLGLVRSGLVHDDPLLAVEHVNRLVSLQKANQLREFLLDKATPLMPGQTPNLETQYVIKRAGTSVDKPLYDALASAHNPEEIRSEIAKYIDENISSDPAVVEGWKGKQQLYTIDKKTVDMLFKYVTGKVPGQATKPVSVGSQVIDAVLNSMRGMLLYANPGFYVANFVGNLGMQMFNDPRSLRYLPGALKEASAQATHGRFHKVDPVFERVNIEMGRGPTSGGLSPERAGILGPELGGPSGPVVGRAAAAVTRGLHHVGTTAGSLVDDAFRVSTWRQEASKLGYRTDQQVLKLLDQGVKDSREKGYMATGTKALDDLAKIRDKAEQLMLDFDSMTPFEKTWLNRIIFLYPFLKASAKYPAMFAGEHPFTFGAAAQTSNVGQQFANQILGPRPSLPLWAQGYARGPGGMYNLGAIDQMSVLAGMIESATHIGRKTPVGINTPWEYLPPIMQLAAEAARGQNRYGRESGVGPILRTDFAVPAWISALYRDPSKLYTQQGEYGALLRSLRLAPFGINPDYGTQTGPGGWPKAVNWSKAGGWPSG